MTHITKNAVGVIIYGFHIDYGYKNSCCEFEFETPGNENSFIIACDVDMQNRRFIPEHINAKDKKVTCPKCISYMKSKGL